MRGVSIVTGSADSYTPSASRHDERLASPCGSCFVCDRGACQDSESDFQAGQPPGGGRTSAKTLCCSTSYSTCGATPRCALVALRSTTSSANDEMLKYDTKRDASTATPVSTIANCSRPKSNRSPSSGLHRSCGTTVSFDSTVIGCCLARETCFNTCIAFDIVTSAPATTYSTSAPESTGLVPLDKPVQAKMSRHTSSAFFLGTA